MKIFSYSNLVLPFIQQLSKPIVRSVMSKKFKLDSHQPKKRPPHGPNKSDCNETNKLADCGDDFVYLATPTKSPFDKKEYSVIRLKNGLTALLITDYPVKNVDVIHSLDSADESSESDCSESANSYDSSSPDSYEYCNELSSEDEDELSSRGSCKSGEEKISACALCVSVGSFSDPEDVPGLAHFLEHMVFMGSEKYPGENEFDAFIKRKGGSNNASTDCEYTTFYFECPEEHLLKGMDIFSQFFISPLMKFEAITREREAIESEFQMALPSDFYRRDQLLSSIAHVKNPAHKFMWGNLITLRDNVKDEYLYESVHKFRERHYSAHRMTLVVQAMLPQEILAKWVVECFSQVKNNNEPPIPYETVPELFNQELFSQIYYIEPVSDICEVELTWLLPSVKEKYKTKPLEYISWLVGHEGKGSLISYLKKKVWALEVVSSDGDDVSPSNSLYSIFSVKIVLTEEGYNNVGEVIEAVFSYIKLLQISGPDERIFKEIQSIEEMNFKYADEVPPVDNVEDLAESMHFYPPEHYLTGSELYFEYDPEDLRTFTDLLTPNNLNIMISSKNVKKDHTLDKVEKWFGTRYTSIDIPMKWLENWKNVTPFSCFHLPDPNVYIATDFSITPVPEKFSQDKYPRKIASNELMELWFKEDFKFNLPQGYMNFHLISPLPKSSALYNALTDIYISCLSNQLIEETYPAMMAEMNYNITIQERGLLVSLCGYNQKLHILLDKIMQGMINFENHITLEMFEAMKKLVHRSYINQNLKAKTLGNALRLSSTIKVYWSSLDRLKSLPEVSFELLKEYSRQLLEHIYIQGLIQGNISEDQAIKISEIIVNSLNCKPLLPSLRPEIRVCQFEKGERFIRCNSFNTKDTNCVTTIHYQYGPGKIKESCILELLQMLLEEPLFDTLRTQEQLGYDVSCSLKDTYGILGFEITVVSQATKCTVDHVEKRINGFMEKNLKKLKELPKKEFEEVVKSEIKLKQCADVHLKEEVKRNLEELASLEYVFDRLEREVECLKTIQLEDVVSIFKELIGPKKKKLVIQVIGSNSKKQGGDEVDYTVSNMNLKLLDKVEGKAPKQFITDTDAYKKHLTIYPINKID